MFLASISSSGNTPSKDLQYHTGGSLVDRTGPAAVSGGDDRTRVLGQERLTATLKNLGLSDAFSARSEALTKSNVSLGPTGR